jgi:RNA polymerase sigma factor (sigma-70 family)
MDQQDQSQLFQQLLEQHKGLLYKVARTYCRDEADRQDLLQEILIQLWQSFHKYNGQFKITTWLYRIALNVAISFYRKNAGRKLSNTPLDDQMVLIQEVDKTDKEAQLLLLEQFIAELRDLDKALMLLYLEERSHVEIAEILGISVSNVATKIGRIKIQLKQKFSDLKS